MFPARAGMDRLLGPLSSAWLDVPRPRGDGPRRAIGFDNSRVCSPPARGWTVCCMDNQFQTRMFPARAGMDRFSRPCTIPTRHVPRPRGDGPRATPSPMLAFVCSPPARGWTDGDDFRLCTLNMFPARAGMDRCAHHYDARSRYVPRPRGDGPGQSYSLPVNSKCSPPARGWTGQPVRVRPRPGMFPARAGMDRSTLTLGTASTYVPRPRGDGPT